MTEFVQIARQPIIDASNNTFGYELLHRDGEGQSIDQSLSNRALSAQVILSVFNLIGRERCVGGTLAFFNIDPEFLQNDILDALPAKQCVFEISANRPLRQNEAAKLKYYFDRGYRFALDNFVVDHDTLSIFRAVLPMISYIKIDVQNSDVESVELLAPQLKEHHILIAAKVETIDEFSAYLDIGFTYFQGYYIKRPLPVKHYRMEPKHFGVTRLYRMLETVPFSEFAREFERHNELTIQFFQYLISTRIKRYNARHSVRELVMDVGPERMKYWLILIVYAKGSADVKEAKSQFSRFFEERIDLMQAIVSNVHSANPDARRDELRLLAIFSTLLDIYQISFDALFGSFEVSKNLELWIVAKKGRFSLLYKAVNQMQHKPVEVEKVNRILKNFKTDYEEVSAKVHGRV
jgi:EAL and modified HD-GYP domain-containing signal transduction protein